MFSQSKWSGSERINLILTDRQANLVSFSPDEGELTIISLPQETRIGVVHGYGDYPLGSLRKLEIQEKRKDLLVESLKENFGIPIDGWVETAGSEQQLADSGQHTVASKEEILTRLRSQMLGGGRSNLTSVDLFRLWWGIRGLRFDKIKTVDLVKTNSLTTQVLADQTQALEINNSNLDERFQRLFFEPLLRQERLGIEVLNATMHPGLGERAARIVNNMGGEVLIVGNSDKQIKKCQASSTKEKKESYTVKKLEKVFNCDWEEKKEEGRAEITLILGEDYWKLLNEK